MADTCWIFQPNSSMPTVMLFDTKLCLCCLIDKEVLIDLSLASVGSISAG